MEQNNYLKLSGKSRPLKGSRIESLKPLPIESQRVPQAKNQLELEELEAIENALKRAKGIQIKAAEILRISLRQLRYRIRKYHIIVRKINPVD
jgi:transcriptional regulator with GAF, ATPase, and Fis domain